MASLISSFLNKFLSNTTNIGKFSALVLVLFSIIIPILSIQYGVTWDERMSIEYSEQILKYFTSFGNDKTCLDVTIPIYNHLIYYGNIFGISTTLIDRILPFNIVVIRHLVNSLLGVLALFYSWKIAKELGGNTLALLTILLLGFSPRFFGHIMNDFRDTTFMFGYISATYYLLQIWKEMPKPSAIMGLKLAISIFITASVRIGGIAIFLVALTMVSLWLILNRRIFGSKSLLYLFVYLSLIFTISYLMIVAIWPWAQQDILSRPFEALFTFSDLKMILNYQLFKGELIPNRDVPIDYLFVWIGITTPIVVLVGLFGLFVKMKFQKHNSLYVILIAFFIPIVLYVLSERNLYDGWRHFLFLAPLLAILSSFGWRNLYILMSRKTQRVLLVFTFSILIFLPVKASITLHPNQTLYFNELIGGIKGAYGKYEIEIDGNSIRTTLDWFNDYINREGLNNITLASNHDGLSISPFIENKTIANNIKWIPYDKLYATDWDYAIVSNRSMSSTQLTNGIWPYQESIYNHVVDGKVMTSILKRGDLNDLKGLEKLKNGQLDQAIPYFQKAIQYSPNTESYHRYLGITYLSMKEYYRAKIAFKRAHEIDSLNPSLLYYMGELEFQIGKFDRSLSYLIEAKKSRLDTYEADCLIAKIYLLKNNYSEALDVMNQLVGQDDINARDKSIIYNGFGELYWLKNDKSSCTSCVNDAIGMFEKSIQSNNKNPKPYLNLIHLYSIVGTAEQVEFTRKIMDNNVN